MRSLGVWIVLWSALNADALVPPLKVAFVRTAETKRNDYRADGVFTGGVDGGGTSILAVRRSYSAKAALERVVVEVGDREAKVGDGKMGYFQASLDPKNERLTLDVSQLRLSKVSEAQVQRLFRGSPFVGSVAFTLDAQDNAATLVLGLKKPVRVEVYRTVKLGSPARIVMDLVPRKGR